MKPVPVYPMKFQRAHRCRPLSDVLDLAHRRAKARLRRQRITRGPNALGCDWMVEDTDLPARKPHLAMEDAELVAAREIANAIVDQATKTALRRDIIDRYSSGLRYLAETTALVGESHIVRGSE